MGLSSGLSSSLAAEFREREVDNHILRELDPMIRLPMYLLHLSLAAVMTASMGWLEEQAIQHDITRLVTLASPGGSGKMRLAQHVASKLVGNFA